jgi:hypothetical protein
MVTIGYFILDLLWDALADSAYRSASLKPLGSAPIVEAFTLLERLA